MSQYNKKTREVRKFYNRTWLSPLARIYCTTACSIEVVYGQLTTMFGNHGLTLWQKSSSRWSQALLLAPSPMHIDPSLVGWETADGIADFLPIGPSGSGAMACGSVLG